MQTSAEVRAHLVRALALDLVGPGPDDLELAEEVLPSAPSLWYLTGFLAPFEAPHHERQGDDAEGEIDATDKRVGKGDDEGAPEAAAARRGFYPASIGLSLIVPAAAQSLAVELTWGDYAPRDPAPDDARLRSRRADPWRRTPRRHPLTIPLDPLPAAPLPVPDSGGLEIVVNARAIDLPGLPPGARTLAVFLVNRRPPVDGPTDLAWCFQVRLHLRADAPLVARPDLRRGDGPDGAPRDWDEEVAALHYRDSYEYAVGHNTAVRPLPEPDGGPCFAVETTWIPAAEVEKVVPADVAAAELGMEALAAAADAPDTLAAALDGLALAYGAWIEDQAARFLVANFAFDRPQGDAATMRARDLWRPLAERMRDHPALDVRLIVNVERGPRDDRRGEHELRARFLDHLRRRLWPGDRLPELYYDPRALHPDPARRASQHAKVVLVDRRRVFLTSANFTQAGQQRNIEAGLLHDDPPLAQQIAANFDALIHAGALTRLA